MDFKEARVKIRVVDVPSTSSASEAETTLNAACEGEAYYLDKIVFSGLPEGVGARAFYRLRVRA